MERAIRELVRLQKEVFSRTDDGYSEISDVNINISALLKKSVQIGFTTLFKDPTLLCQRTKITPTATRIATLSDTTQDWCRSFVLYIDFITSLPEMKAFSHDDQIIFAESRFPGIYLGSTILLYQNHITSKRSIG
jgi:hypothetical protein